MATAVVEAATVVLVRYLAQELPHAIGAAKKHNKNTNTTKQPISDS